MQWRPDPVSIRMHLVAVPEAAWKNLAVSAVFEPGSTFKPFIVGWAIQNDVLAIDEMIDCSSGVYRMGPRVLHDHHSYGALSVEDVLVKSSNIGMAKIGERIGIESLYEATRAFGFGRRTGIELPGELSGLLRPVAQWDVYSLGSIPDGAGTGRHAAATHHRSRSTGKWWTTGQTSSAEKNGRCCTGI